MTLTFTRINQNGVETAHEIPAKYDVCEKCEGHGTHLHEDIGSHAYSREEFYESFDEEEAGEYFKRGGRYDVQCTTCNGAKVIPVVDDVTCERTLRGRRLLRLYDAYLEQRADWAREEANERRWSY